MKLELNRVEEPFVMELVNESGNSCFMDASPAIGGLNKGFRPMELLAGSLAGCVSIDVLNILRKQRAQLDNYKVRIEAQRKDGVPAPFELIHLVFELDSTIAEDKARRAIDMTLEKYCSVSASLSDEVKVTYEINFI